MNEEPQGFKNTPIGNKPTQKLKAAKCQVVSAEEEYVEKAKMFKAVFLIKHPEKEENLKLSAVTLMRQKKGKREIVSSATWIQLDEDKHLAMDSALVQCLKHYNASILNEMVEKTIDTEAGEDGYLTIKAY